MLLILPSVAAAQCVSRLTVQSVLTQDAGGNNKTTFAPGESIRIVGQINNGYGAYMLAANGAQIAVRSNFYNDTKSVDIPPGVNTWPWNATVPSSQANYTVTVNVYDHFCGVWVGESASFTLVLGIDDYPMPLCPPTAQDDRRFDDPWQFLNRECTSFVAWRLNSTYGFPAAFTNNLVNNSNNTTVHFGNAYQWADAAKSLDIPIDGSTAPRAIAYWAQNTAGAGASGHVAWVESVNPDGSITTEDYNWAGTGIYRKVKLSASEWKSLQFIHFGDWWAKNSQSRPPGNQAPPEIVDHETFREGALVFFQLFFTDPNNNATGFGFKGVNGSGWAEENHPFTSTSYGRMAARLWRGVRSIAIEYPFNHGCGTTSAYESDVEVWINDSTGRRSQSKTIQLKCSAQTEEPFSCVRVTPNP